MLSLCSIVKLSLSQVTCQVKVSFRTHKVPEGKPILNSILYPSIRLLDVQVTEADFWSRSGTSPLSPGFKFIYCD